ncbi:MAG: sulfatase-like hydrolase/transferase, partial [Planctomycetales bacterium]|nr:sulfatase-like hydrolase/transferase [Planctomycetales bacterium]
MQQQTHPASAVVVVIEGLGTNLVGAYGSSTAITPTLDQMASQGVLLDQCFLDSQQLHEQLRSLWTAAHALQTGALPWNLWQAFAARWGGGSRVSGLARLLTDSPQVAELAEQM